MRKKLIMIVNVQSSTRDVPRMELYKEKHYNYTQLREDELHLNLLSLACKEKTLAEIKDLELQKEIQRWRCYVHNECKIHEGKY